jgi:HEAT repeat protein
VLAAAAEDEERAAEAGDAGAPEEQGPQTVSKDDFNPTMYALDPKEMEILGAELKKEMERDLMGDVLAALLDRLEEPENRQRQSEILEILKALLPSFLSRGQITAATQVFRELRALEELEGGFDEQRLAECREIVEEVSTPEVVSELIQALFDGTIKASSAQFGAFLQFLGGGALAPLLRSSKTVDHKKLRTVLRDAVQRIAEANPDAVVKLLEDEDEDAVVAGAAVRFASEMQIVEAGPALVGLFTHLDSTVRLAAIEAAISLKAPTAANALQQMLADPAVDIRIAAARGIGRLAHRPAAGALAEIVQGKEIRNADVSEKVAFFEAFGMLADDEGVAILDRLLNSKRFLGKREPSAIRAVAALGLGALFHDIGKQRVDYDVINKAGGLTDDEWAQLKEHTTEGLLLLFGMHGFADTPYRQMLMAYEHHMKIDLTGYPSNTRPRQPTLFSRIVAVADAFDAGTSVRSYQYEPWSPDAVLKEMRDNPKRGQDVLLVKALITATGVYPVGTLVILDTRELGVVAQVNPDLSLLHRPTIRLISDPQGRPLARPLTVNLSKSDPATGQVRKIIKTTDPQRYGIRVSDYLLA